MRPRRRRTLTPGSQGFSHHGNRSATATLAALGAANGTIR
jgi:hypothetical protein